MVRQVPPPQMDQNMKVQLKGQRIRQRYVAPNHTSHVPGSGKERLKPGTRGLFPASAALHRCWWAVAW